MNRPLLILVSTLLTCIIPSRAAPPIEAVDCEPVLQTMRAEISAKPSRVLIAVEDALTMNEQAACEIVKEAIESTRADARLVGEIVYTALRHSPAMSAVIVECAVATAPHAVEEIKKAMERALGDKAGSAVAGLTEGSGKAPSDPATGKEAGGAGRGLTGKGVEVQPTVPVFEEDFGFSSVGVGGIYLMTPSNSYYRCDLNVPCCTGDLTQACLRP